VAADTFTVNAGVLEGKADPTHPALGAAGIMLNGGTLKIDAATAASTLANVVSVAANSTLTTTGASSISLSNPVAFTTPAGLTSSGTAPLILSATGGLTLNGSDTLTVSGTGGHHHQRRDHGYGH